MNIEILFSILIVLTYLVVIAMYNYRICLIKTCVGQAINICYANNLVAIQNLTYDGSSYGGYEPVYNFSYGIALLQLHKWKFDHFFPTLIVIKN